MPWQGQVADVAGELLADGSLAYREVVVTVPRQSGKTTLVLSFSLDTNLARGQLSTYTAQTGQDAMKKMLGTFVPAVLRTPDLRPLVEKVHRRADHYGLEWVNGAGFYGQSSAASAGHGDTIGMGTVDEAFKDTDDRREQAMLPAMLTVPDAQMWVASTQGDAGSIYLNRKTELGRSAALEDRGTGVCYFEWSAPLDADPYDPETWRACMPALGITISEAAVQHAADTMETAEFARAMLNQRNNQGAEQPLPEVVWRLVLDHDAAPAGRQLSLGVESALDRSWSALVLADDFGQVDLVEYREGSSWVPAAVAEWVERTGCDVVLDPRGPSRAHLRGLERAGIEVEELSTPEVAAANLGFVDAVFDRQLAVQPHPALAAAVDAGRRRWSGEQWFWDRAAGLGEVSPLISATLAVYWAGTARAEPANGPALFADVDEEQYAAELERAKADYEAALEAVRGGK